jgi:dihydrofolate reductase
MRKIIVQEFITLDGVMQAPGGPDEDTSSGFKWGGWTAPYFHEADAEAERFMAKVMASSDLLLGRKTFDIFAAYWPKHADMWPGIMDVTKYCVSSTLEKSDWTNSVFLKDFEMTDSLVTKNGVIFANYKRAGEVKTGTVGDIEEVLQG